MKLLVRTTGAFSLQTPEGQDLSRKRAHVVRDKMSFIHVRIGRGDLKTLAQLNDDATDDEYKATLDECEGDEALAVASFQERFPVDGALPAVVTDIEGAGEPQLTEEQLAALHAAAEAVEKARNEAFDKLIADNADKAATIADKPGNINWFVGQLRKATDDKSINADWVKAAFEARAKKTEG